MTEKPKIKREQSPPQPEARKLTGVWSAAKDEIFGSPINTLGNIAGILALALYNPELLNFSAAPRGAEPAGNHGVVVWSLLYVSTCFLLGRFGSAVAKRNPISGALSYIVLGVVAVFMGAYLASSHLAAFPLTSDGAPSFPNHTWIGLDLSFFSFIAALAWTLIAVACYAPAKETWSGKQPTDDEMSTLMFVIIFTGIGLALALAFFAVIFNGLILGLVPVVEPGTYVELTLPKNG